MDQFTDLSGEDAQLVLRGIGDLDIQISLRHFDGGIFDFRNWSLDQAYDYKREEDAHEDYSSDNRDHQDGGGSIKGGAFRRRLVAAFRIVGDNIIEGAV